MISYSYVIKYLDDALLSRWVFEAGGPTCGFGGLVPVSVDVDVNVEDKKGYRSEKGSTWKERLRFGFWVVFNARLIGSRWAVPGLRMSRKRKLQEKKWEWMAWNGAVALGWVFARRTVDMWLLDESVKSPVVSVVALVIGDGELAERVGTVLSFYASLYFSLDSCYRIIGLLCVGLGITDVDGWLPAFGKLSEARGVRLFWGRFWHQLSRRFHSAIAYFITYYLLRLPKSSLAAGCALTTLVFTSSGLWHLVGNLTSGVPISESGAMSYFCIQSLGIMLEDAFQALFFPTAKEGREKQKQPPSIWMRAAGHLWLVAWLTWTTTPWMDPTLAEQKRRRLAANMEL
ncbi:membrane bound O-acyl transferase family-domain-containing protein [Cladorrhinum sp. PSN332]|nr:membrane bound O-acyl transferase family-domain-containing protein [Cladorrhinum sp. PSN332]